MVGASVAFIVSTGISMGVMGINMNWEPLSSQLVAVDSHILTPEESAGAPQMLREDMLVRLMEANKQEGDAIYQMRWQEAWEQYRDGRLKALKDSLGEPPSTPMQVEVTGTIPGEGYRIEKLVIAGRPGLPITANLYMPEPLRQDMPGIVICSSHHNPKHQGELQDMGMTWARAGTIVLVPDHLGHGERRQQPFAGREDYHWRYNIGLQLYLAGESLLGWMVADLQRCVDVLLARPGIDPKRIIMIGAVAGGGEPAAVTTALDPRVTCSIPFNFGPGSQTELPGEPGPFYRWDGFGDWETTRCLRNSARDKFFPWMIVAAAAPRPLIVAKEFTYDAANDAAYQRIQGIYRMYDAVDRTGEVHGFGNVKLNPPAASHCNNVGPIHRKQIYPQLQKWLGMAVPQEYQHRLEPTQLNCMTPQAEKTFGVRMVHEAAAEVAAQRTAKAREQRAALDTKQRRQKLREAWTGLLGEVEPKGAPRVVRSSATQPADVKIEKVLLEVDRRIQLPVVLLVPPAKDKQPTRRPVVIGISQQGKAMFLAKRTSEVAELLRQGVIVCLPDVRGTGETSPGPERTYMAGATEVSAEELKLGQPLLGSRLRDLRSVMRYLASREDIDAARVGLWGDSFAPTNPDAFVDPPIRTDLPPNHAEPMGAMLAMLGALYEDNVKAVIARGGLTSYAAVLETPAFYVPHDAIVPGVLTIGDICDVAGALAPLPLRVEGVVDGRDRVASQASMDKAFGLTQRAYAASPAHLVLSAAMRDGAGEWLSRNLAD